MLAVVRGASNSTYADEAARQTSVRNTASAECRVLEEDRKVLIAQLRHKECCDAMATAAQNAAVGAKACLAVQQVLYQSSTALELVALTVDDDATGDGDIDLPSKGEWGDPFVHPHAAEGGGVQLPATMGDTGPEEQQQPSCCGAVHI